jgi:hypothetical protein
MKRNNKKSTDKKTNKRKTNKRKINYIDLSGLEDVVEIEDGAMWLKSGKYDSPSVSVMLSDDDMLSDWMRKITLRNVVLTVEENDNGYPELIISGQSDEDEEDDAGDE